MDLSKIVTAQLIVNVAVILVVVHVILLTVAYLIYLERKISAYIQDRVGPNRVGFDFGLPILQKLTFGFGFWGLGQPLADGLKFLLKEDYTPSGVDKILFTLGPMFSIIPALMGFVILPWGGVWVMPELTLPFIGTIAGGPVLVAGANVNVGIIYMLAVASVGVYGVSLGGWASNNKYSFLGGMRATAQMISYEIPLGLALLAVLLMVGSLTPERIIGYQLEHGWLVFSQPLACVIFFIAILAEANRAPFDIAEAESELVGGYHTEYSAMRFAMYFLAEYAHMITSCGLFALIFLGGWDVAPFHNFLPLETSSILVVLAKFGIFYSKVLVLIAFMMVIRWSLPRLRYDQIMQVAWQGVIPLALVVVVLTSVMVYFRLTDVVPMLIANAIAIGAVLWILPRLPRNEPNRKIRLAGSRFYAPDGHDIETAPTDPMALEDRPYEGSLPAH
ncbi:MAG: NADH-quinone oxidoreductase subunit H [Phycisphaeraceae bacterium]|nr:NADH-quinone oxidoreductase subunit H [Phycisphaeraceae bacterium]